jgi:outer membrane receptor protein involved in Fe transport
MQYPFLRHVGTPMLAAWLLALSTPPAFADAPAAPKAAALAELSLDALLDMEVTGPSRFAQRRSQSASSVSVISAADIRAHGWRTVAEALASVKGLVVANDHTYAYLGVRGFFAQGDYNTRVLLLIDGNRINENVYDMAFLGTEFPLDLELVDRIEFIPGQGSAVYGQNALFAVVNIITRESVGDGLEASLSSGTGHHDIVRVGGSRKLGEHGSLLANASRTRAKGPAVYLAEHDNPPESDGIARNVTYERRDSLYLRLEDGPWRSSLVHADRTKGVPAYVGFIFDDPRSYYRDLESLLDLAWSDHIGDRTQGHVRWFIGHYWFEGDYAVEGFPDLNRDEATGQWWGLEARLLSTRWDRHTLVAGVEFQKNTRQSLKNFDLDAVRTTYFDGSRDTARTAVFAEDQVQLDQDLSLTVGARFDHTDGSVRRWNPRLALNWRPDPALVVKAIHGSAYRPANQAETVQSDGRLRSETVRGDELALEWQLDPRRRFSLSWFHNVASRLIAGGAEPATGLWVYQNIGRLSATGAELEYEQRFASGANLRANATFQHAHDSGELAIAQYAPQRIGNLLWSQPLGGHWTAGLHFNAAARRGASAGYGVLNLQLSQHLPVRGWSFSFGVRDLFDRRPDEPGNDPAMQPRIAQLGRAWTARLDLRY